MQKVEAVDAQRIIMCAFSRNPRTGSNLTHWSEKTLTIISNIEVEGRGRRCSKDNEMPKVDVDISTLTTQH